MDSWHTGEEIQGCGGWESETPVAQAEDLSSWGDAGFQRHGRVYPLCCEIEPFLEMRVTVSPHVLHGVALRATHCDDLISRVPHTSY